MSEHPPHRCYAIRRLNPFKGVIQVLQLHSSRAISLNGRNWEIQVNAVRPDDMWGAVTPGPETYEYLRFGIWSRQQGLQRVPAHPLLDISPMLEKVELLTGILEQEQARVPFPLADRYEFWLLDGVRRLPLALLASSVRPSKRRPKLSWLAAEPADGDFNSIDADLIHPRHPRDRNPHPHMSALKQLLQVESGHAAGQWFERDAAGYGRGDKVEAIPWLDGRELAPSQFPELPIRGSWEDRYAEALVSGYLVWLSPLLLTLQKLTEPTRKWLEQHARNHAERVNAHWLLYPKEVNQALIDTARVEARIREAQ